MSRDFDDREKFEDSKRNRAQKFKNKKTRDRKREEKKFDDYEDFHNLKVKKSDRKKG